jgi:hypothetical protein
MNKLCVLCEDENVVEARRRAVTTLPGYNNLSPITLEFKKARGIDIESGSNHLTVGCSPTGESPATHWFCFITVDNITHQKMLENQLYTTIEEGRVPSEFLEDHGLKRIKSSWRK